MSTCEDRIEKFLAEVEGCSREFLSGSKCLVLKRKVNFLKVRFQVRVDTFMDIYYNSYSERKDYVLVRQGKRIFGYDNLYGWHYHPVSDPKRHITCKEPSLEKVFEKISKLAR